MPVLLHAAAGLDACDAACYMAKHQACRCICGGINHGVGLKRAAENTRRYKERHGQTSLLDLMAQTAPTEAPEQTPCPR